MHFGHRYSCQDADRVYTLIDTVVEIKTWKKKYLHIYLTEKKDEKTWSCYIIMRWVQDVMSTRGRSENPGAWRGGGGIVI